MGQEEKCCHGLELGQETEREKKGKMTDFRQAEREQVQPMLYNIITKDAAEIGEQ